jgi:hypothetical protein
MLQLSKQAISAEKAGNAMECTCGALAAYTLTGAGVARVVLMRSEEQANIFYRPSKKKNCGARQDRRKGQTSFCLTRTAH